MNWFKHYANMATDERMMRMESEMGYIGTGIFWRAMELINGMGGSYPLKGLLYTIKNRHAKQGKVMQVIMGYGLFEVDSVGLVRFCEVSKRTLAEPSQLPNGTASEDAIIGTRVIEREEREKESPSDSPVEMVANDDDRRGVPCGYPNETENTHHGAPTRDAPTVDNKESPIRQSPTVQDAYAPPADGDVGQQGVCIGAYLFQQRGNLPFLHVVDAQR